MNGGLIKSCELVARVRSGRVKQAGLSGVVMYNADLSHCTRCGRFVLHGVYNYCPFCGESVEGEELRGRGEWIRLDSSLYVCSLCGKSMPEETGFCPRCGAKMDSKEADLESNCGDVSRQKRSPLEDTVSNGTEGVRKKISEKEMMTWWKLDVGTGILTLRKDDDSKKLYDGEWDVSKGMRLTVTRKRGDSVHVVVPCNLEKNAKLHQFTNADGINMSAIYTEDEDGEFEEASCMLADEGKMIAWWNELHRKKD